MSENKSGISQLFARINRHKNKKMIYAMLAVVPAAALINSVLPTPAEVAADNRLREEAKLVAQQQANEQAIALAREEAERKQLEAYIVPTENFCRNAARLAHSPRRPDFGGFLGGDYRYFDSLKTVIIGYEVENAFGGKNHFNIECKQLDNGIHKVVEINRLS